MTLLKLKNLFAITLLSLFVIVINTPKAEAVCYGKKCCKKSPAKELGFYNPKTSGAYFPPECCPGLETVTPASLGKDPVCKKKKKKPVVIIKKAKKKTKRVSKSNNLKRRNKILSKKRLVKRSKRSTREKYTAECKAMVNIGFKIDNKSYGKSGFIKKYSATGNSYKGAALAACKKGDEFLSKNAESKFKKAFENVCKNSEIKGKTGIKTKYISIKAGHNKNEGKGTCCKYPIGVTDKLTGNEIPAKYRTFDCVKKKASSKLTKENLRVKKKSF